MRDLLASIKYRIEEWRMTLFIPKGAKKLLFVHLKQYGPKECTVNDVMAWRVDTSTDSHDPYAYVVTYKGKAYQGEI